MTEPRHDDGPAGAGADPHLLLGAYALDAVDDGERVAFEEHLADCADCRRELAGFTETAGCLAAAVGEPPPPSLRDRVLAAADATAQARPPADGQGADRGVAPPSVAADDPIAAGGGAPGLAGHGDGGSSGGAVGPGEDGEVPTALRRARRLRPALVLALAAAVVVLGGLAVAVVRLQHQIDDLSRRDAVLAAPDARRVELRGELGGELRLTWSPALGEAYLDGDGVPGVPDHRTYQLWFIGADGPASAGTFRPDDEGSAELLAAGDLAGTDVVGVTEEPEGGSPAPTGDVLASAELTG